MTTLSSLESQGPSRTRRCARFVVIMFVLGSVMLLAERWRGQWALSAWKRQMTAQGEVLEITRLWPTPSPASGEFSNRMAKAIQELPPGLGRFAGQLSGIVQEEPGKCRRGSQEVLPPLTPKNPTNTWQDLDGLTRQAQPSLQSLREIMKTPPRDEGYDIVESLENNSFPGYVNVRRGAQALHAATIDDLHNGNLSSALANLTALSAFGRLYTDDPGLVNLMIKVAISGLTTDACWDALQASGWTEQQLAILQQGFQQESLLPQMARSINAERANRLHDLNWFRSHSYETWITRNLPMFEVLFGRKLADFQTTASMRWHEWVFHPVWSFAWAHQEELDYLRQVQLDLRALRQAPNHRSWFLLNQQLAENHLNYRPPVAAWRFYLRLPLSEELYKIGGDPAAPPAYPYPDYPRAWRVAFQDLTLREMVIAVIAIKRYELREGKPPASLAALLPDFLDATPCDLMDGQPLRYRLNPDGSFTLYSVGKDAHDDGGNSAATDVRDTEPPWRGGEWVWPRAVATAQPLLKTATFVR